MEINGYELSRNWFNFCFENPELIKPNHSAIYFFAIEHCNRLGWKTKFGFPTTMAMEATGIKSYNTYIKSFNEIVSWGFIVLIEKSKNQYSSNIIAISINNKALDKALDKALTKHSTKHYVKQRESNVQSNSSIDKQYNKEQYNKEQLTSSYSFKIDFNKILELFNSTCKSLKPVLKITEDRKVKIQKIIDEYKPDDSLAFFEVVFNKINQSNFLNGGGKNGFLMTFDWMLKPENFLKIIENNYQDEKRNNQKGSKSIYSDDFKRKIAKGLQS